MLLLLFLLILHSLQYIINHNISLLIPLFVVLVQYRYFRLIFLISTILRNKMAPKRNDRMNTRSRTVLNENESDESDHDTRLQLTTDPSTPRNEVSGNGRLARLHAQTRSRSNTTKPGLNSAQPSSNQTGSGSSSSSNTEQVSPGSIPQSGVQQDNTAVGEIQITDPSLNPANTRPSIEDFLQRAEREKREAAAAEREQARVRAELEAKERQEEEQRAKEAEDAAHRSRQERILKELEDERTHGHRLPLQHFTRGDPTHWLPQEVLNGKIHLAIIETVKNLTAVGHDRLPDVLEVDRLTIGDDRNQYEFNHEGTPGQTPHSVQRRTLLAITSSLARMRIFFSIRQLNRLPQ